MTIDFLPFAIPIDPLAIAGATLWALALYLGLSPVSDWVTLQLSRWFNYAERSLYTSQAEFERTRAARESLNAFYASFCSILPFLLAGTLCEIGIELALGPSWGLSMGLLASISCGVYELGRRSS